MFKLKLSPTSGIFSILPFLMTLLLLLAGCQSYSASLSELSETKELSDIEETHSTKIPHPEHSEHSHSTKIPNPEDSEHSEEVEMIAVSASYAEVLPEAKVETSDLIVLGLVKAVSPTKFNSDDGTQWESSSDLVLPIHTITLSVKEILKGDQLQSDEIEITVIGSSPADEKVSSHTDHDIQVGQNIIAYLNNTSLIWKDGETRPKFIFITSPESSYKVELEDGLFYSHDENERPQLYEEILAEVR